MNIIHNKKWKTGFLDYALQEEEVRIRSQYWVLLSKVETQFIERPKSWRLVFNYLKEIGVKYVLLKIISRLSERFRNEKYISFGIGTVIKTKSAKFKKGQKIVFIAHNHPQLVDILSLHVNFISLIENYPDMQNQLREDCITWINAQNNLVFNKLVFPIAGYSYFSNIASNIEVIKNITSSIYKELIKKEFYKGEEVYYDIPKARETIENTYLPNSNEKTTLPTGVIFGLGNYAKTNILPHAKRNINFRKIHEIDPLQIGEISKFKYAIDTAPFPRNGELFDVYFIAGYHHTHGKIAHFALRNGKYAVVEKPIVTTWEYFASISKDLKQGNQKLFSCFHKRYLPFNQLAKKDLNIKQGDPISYFCIVYEIPLPRLHWYNWPSSKSRIVSNGCHWIDHFLFLNDYVMVKNYNLNYSKDGDISIFMELENGAVLNMVLTDKGSDRLGVRDYVQLRANGNTVYMTDGSQYKSENSTRTLRTTRINKMDSYSLMYQTITKKIRAGEKGDNIKTLYSTEIMLKLDDALAKIKKHSK